MNALSGRWLACIGGLVLSLVLVLTPLEDAVWAAAADAAALVIAALAVGVRRSTSLGLIGVGGALAGALLPAWVASAVLGLVCLGLLAFFSLLWVNSPFSGVVARPGMVYRVRGRERVLPRLDLRGAPPRILKQPLLDRLDELVSYADSLLDRHGIRYVAQCGTLLGSIRHGGLIPWDDDVDFRFNSVADEERLREREAAIRDEAHKDGFVLFRHGPQWKLGVDNFWRYPSVDLFNVSGKTNGATPLRVPFEDGEVNVPADPAAAIRSYYGESALKQIVHDLPFWDSGFVPSMVDRLFGYRFKCLATDLYEKLFIVTSK